MSQVKHLLDRRCRAHGTGSAGAIGIEPGSERGRARSAIGVDTVDAARIRSPPGLIADQRAAEQPDGGQSETAVSQPHDKYFQQVFSNEQDAASLLRTCVPRPLADALKWSTLTLLRGRFVADDWRRNETDMQ